MASTGIQGLPPLPKSLSGLLNRNAESPLLTPSSSTKNIKTTPGTKRDSPRNESSAGSSLNSSPRSGAKDWTGPQTVYQNTSSSNASKKGSSRRGQVPLESQLHHLRKEMVHLRQMDMNLLCQLWSLNESIQDFKNNRLSVSGRLVGADLKFDEESDEESSDLDDLDEELMGEEVLLTGGESEFYAEPSKYSDGEQLQLLQEHHRRLQERVRFQHLQRSSSSTSNSPSGRSRSSYLPSTDI